MDGQRPNDPNFLRKATTLVLDHISDQFSGNELAELIFLSREQTHRKIKQMTSVSTGRFIRYIRLLQSLVYLQSGNYTVAEVGFKVGFDDPAWFSKCFREEIGVAPLEIKKTGTIPSWQSLPVFKFYELPEVNEVLKARQIVINLPSEMVVKKRTGNGWVYIAPVLAVLITSLLLLSGNNQSKQNLHIPTGKRIAVLPFNNQTGDTALRLLGDMAGSWISGQLGDLDSFQTVPWFTVKQYENYIGVLPNDPDNKPSFSELVSADYLVSGDYFVKDNEVYFTARFIDAHTSEIVYDLPATHGTKDSAMNIIENIRVKIAGLITNLEAVKVGKLQPPNLDAYRYYLRGMEELNTGLYSINAREYFKKAVSLEPNFVEPRIFLTWTLGGIKQDSMVNMMLAILNTPGITRYEKSICETWAAIFQRQHQKALNIALSNLDRYPKDYYFNMLGGYLAKSLFMPSLSLRILDQLKDPLQSDFGKIWHYFKVYNYSESLIMLGRLEQVFSYLASIPDEHYNPEIPRLFIYAKVVAGKKRDDILAILDSIASTKVAVLKEGNRLEENKLMATWYLSAAWDFSLFDDEASCRYFASKALAYLAQVDDDSGYGFDKTDALFLNGQYSDAAMHIRGKLKQDPLNDDLWIYLAQTEAAMGNAKEAFRIMNRFGNRSLVNFRRNEYPYQKDYINARIYALLHQENKATALIASALEKGELNSFPDYRRDIFLKSIFHSDHFLELTAPR
jgi:AraC-like DNA-binding protein/TolB-like protein